MDMNDYHIKTIKIFCFIFSLLIHALLGFSSLLDISSFLNPPSKMAIKLKNDKQIRDLGKKESKVEKATYSPKEKNELDMLKEFAIAKDNSKSKQDSKDKSDNKFQKPKNNTQAKKIAEQIRQTQKVASYTSRQAVSEVKKERSIENPVLNNLNYNLQFIPPKGIPEDELNDFEKVFYAFYKRVATQYINSIQSTYLTLQADKPYMENRIRQHKPVIMTAFIQYDSDGNAEVIKIIKSSEDNEVHQMFETALKRMNKIPNIAKELINEDGKYQTFFQLSINEQKQF